MALVAYDNSDVSESDEEESQSSSAKNTIAEVVTSSKQDDDTNVDSSNIADAETTLSSGGLFASLPTPRSRSGQGVTVDEEDDDFITIKSSIGSSIRHQKNKEGKPVRIVIPALSEFPEEEEPSASKRRPSAGSGLLSILPEPKNLTTKTTSKSLIPHSVAKQQKKPTPGSAQQSTKKPVKVTESPSKLSVHNDGSDEEEDVRNEPIDFFSLTDVEQPSLTDGLSNSLDPSVSVSDSDAAVGSYQSSDMASYQNESLVSLSSSSGLSNYATMTVDNTLIQNYQASSYSSQQVDEGVQSYSNGNDEDPLLKDEGFLRLHGRKKRGKDDIQIIDVSQDDQLPKPEEWLNQVLSQEAEYQPSRKKGFMPTAQQRRKHQITYLAFQAKQREIELKNMWAENRMTRRQTQAKYGF